MKGGRPHPNFVCRTAGLPVAVLDGLRAVSTVAAHDRALAVEKRAADAADALADALYGAIDGEEDRTLRRALLRLKRDAHNGRPLRAVDLEKARAAGIPDALDQALEGHVRLAAELQEALETVRRTFEEERLEIRERFRRAIRDDDFRAGLLLSSRTLFDSLPRYLRASPSKPGAKARQIERSLLRYLSRMVMKATPFSTFCTLLPGRLRPGRSRPERPTFDGDPGTKVARLRLDKAIYASLLPHLLGSPELRRHFPVEVNPTLQEESPAADAGAENGPRRWLFLARQGTQEVFQRLPPNPIVELLRDHLASAGATPFGELVALLGEHADADVEGATAYLDRLIDIGLLRFRLGISEQEVDWDAKLVERLRPIDAPLAARLCRFLDELRATVDAYGRAPVDERPALLRESTRPVRELFAELAPTAKAADKVPFYEDAGGEARLGLELGPIEDCLLEYVELTSRLVHPRNDQANMRHFFDAFYGPDAPPVPLLRFYEDFYREHFKEHLERRQRPNLHRPPAGEDEDAGEDGVAEDGAAEDGAAEDGADDAEKSEPYDVANPFGLPFLREIDRGFVRLKARIGELWRQQPEAEALELDRGDLEAAVGHLPPLEVDCGSVSLFTQYVHGGAADGGPALVARGYLAGYGKYFSRFLYLLPEAVLEELRQGNRGLTDQELAEICGNSQFNANLHPSLLPAELGYPTGESTDGRQIPAAELGVGRDPASPHRLRLLRGTHPDSGEKTVIPVDLGFLNPRMRPPLFQLLSRFTPVASFGLPLPDSPDEGSEAAQGPEGVIYRPRITYRSRLVLARRQWRVDVRHFPTPRADETDADFFCRLRAWRLELGLPSEVFLRVDVRRAARPGEVRQHLYKPQYLDFDDPLLVDLLVRTCESLDAAVLGFEERLPAHEHLVASEDGERWATEMIFQLDFPAEGGDRP